MGIELVRVYRQGFRANQREAKVVSVPRLAVKVNKSHRCPRCLRGYVVYSHGEKVCLNCGFDGGHNGGNGHMLSVNVLPRPSTELASKSPPQE